MTDREKIIEIIKRNGTYNGRSLSFDYYVIQPDDLADALIAEGYGNVAEWKRRAEVAGKKYNIALVSYAKCHRKITHYNKMTTTYDREITQQAEREIEEERK